MKKLNNYAFRILGFSLYLVLGISCAATVKSGSLTEDELSVSRKYAGNFIDYKYTDPSDFGWPNTVWIRTTMDSVYGKISVYAHSCEFKPGEKLYIRRAHTSYGISDYWIYQIENEKENITSYKLTEFQGSNNKLTQYFR